MSRFRAAVIAVCFVLAGCGTAPPDRVPAPIPDPGTSGPSAAPEPSAPSVAVPAGVIAGIAVFDRTAGKFTVQIEGAKRFRSASIVKIFIAMAYLWDRGPDYSVPPADLAQLQLMLQSSDDAAASHFYSKIGGEPALVKMFNRLALEDTKPPSAVGLNGWGSTTLSANDVVRTYRYLLEQAPAGMRGIIIGNMRLATPCGTDRYYQSFGIPHAVAKPWTAKQGWWGFGDAPSNVCTDQKPTLPVPSAAPAIKGEPPALMSGRVLHTTGTAGNGDRYVVAVLTQFPSGTRFTDAAATITLLTRSLGLPGTLH